MIEMDPGWYGNVEAPLRCSSCGHEMFAAERDDDAGIEFCPKCGTQSVEVGERKSDTGRANDFKLSDL